MSLVTLILLNSCRKETEPGSHTWENSEFGVTIGKKYSILNPIPSLRLQHTSQWHSGRNNFSSCSFWSPKASWLPSLQGDMVTAQGGMHRWWFSGNSWFHKLCRHDPESVCEVREERAEKIPRGIVHYSPSYGPHSQPEKSLHSP